MPKALMLVFTESSDPDRDDEYNQWYDDAHIPDVLKVDGIKAATRYRFAEDAQGPTDVPAKYLAVYEVEADDLSTIMPALGQRSASGEMPIFDALQVGQVVFFEEITARQTE